VTKRNGFERNQSWHNQSMVLAICLEGLRKTNIRSSLSETDELVVLDAMCFFLLRLIPVVG
jgi:hypothetical protein